MVGPQKVQGAMTMRDGADEGAYRAEPGGVADFIARPDHVRGRISTDAESEVMAPEKVNLVDALADGGEAKCEIPCGILHVPGARRTDGRADVRLDAMHGAEPVRMGEEERAILLALERRSCTGREALEGGLEAGQLAVQRAEHPGEREVRSERRRNELVIGARRQLREVFIEEVIPSRCPEFNGRVGRQLSCGPAGRIMIDNQDAFGADRSGACGAKQLARVKGAVAAATEDREAHGVATQACPLAAAAAASRSLNTLRFVEWPGLTRAFGSMKWTALLTAMQASPKPVAMSSSLPAYAAMSPAA